MLREIERAAGAAFRGIGMEAVADDEPPSPLELFRFQRDGRGWVATTDEDVPIAYLLVEIVEDCARIEQVSVHPSYARRRIGEALLDTAAAWAARRSLVTSTLTTYVDVPWNAPYFRRLGFTILTDEQVTDGLRRIREHEASRGLDRWPRVSMRRPVDPAGPRQ